MRSKFAAGPRALDTRIRPVIDCSDGEELLPESLASVPDGARPVIVGKLEAPGAIAIQTIGQLAREIEDQEVWLCLMAPGDRLAEGALAAYAAAIAERPDAGVFYADDDLIDDTGARTSPHFKPSWNPELFEHHDFLTGAAVVKISRKQLRSLPQRGWQAALVKRTLKSGVAPQHLPLVLHHRRARPQPMVPERPAKVTVEGWPLISVIVPTRNRANLLRTCIEGLDRTSYPSFEAIVIDNESDEPESLALLGDLRERGIRVVEAPGPFNYSRLNNEAVGSARGELLCFLNNDIEIDDPQWLSLLAAHAVRPDVGAVGARLLYPDGRVQHAGVFTGVGGGAAHGHRFQGPDQHGYFERSRLPQRVSAVTGACLVVARSKFLAVGGFDEENFPVAFNDVDLCLKLNERGWHAFYEPRATLVHHESISRGKDSSKENRVRFARELAMLKRRWHTDERPDPFHHPHLSPFCEQFLIAV